MEFVCEYSVIINTVNRVEAIMERDIERIFKQIGEHQSVLLIALIVGDNRLKNAQERPSIEHAFTDLTVVMCERSCETSSLDS